MSFTHGMDLAAVEELGRFLQLKAGEIRTLSGDVESTLNRTAWIGDDGGVFRQTLWPAHRTRLASIADDIHGFGQSALNNASEQREASQVRDSQGRAIGGAGGSGKAPYVEHRETYAITSEGTFAVLTASSESSVTLERMSDGTYRVIFDGTTDGDLGVSAQKLLKTLGIQAPGELGIEAGAGGGLSMEFSAPDEKTARALMDELAGRSASFTNRSVLGGGVSTSELDHLKSLDLPGVKVESFSTRENLSAGGGAGAGSVGGSADLHGSRVTTYHTDGSRDVTWSEQSTLRQSGWNQDSVGTGEGISVHYGTDGKPQSVTVTHSETSVADLRGGGEKARDTVLGFFGVKNSELASTTRVTSTTYDASVLSQEQITHAANGDAAVFRSSAANLPGHQVVDTFTGDSTSATRGVLGVSSTTERGSSDLQSHEESEVGRPGATGSSSGSSGGGW
jgi:hypothetical protein